MMEVVCAVNIVRNLLWMCEPVIYRKKTEYLISRVSCIRVYLYSETFVSPSDRRLLGTLSSRTAGESQPIV